MAKFYGGVHPPEKKYTKNKKIVDLPIPQKVVIHLSQHTGKPAKPIVKVGDYVETGQKIAIPDGVVSSTIHSSISGKVINIDNFWHPVAGKKLPAIVVESDNIDRWTTPKKPSEYFRHSKEGLIQTIKDSGIVGLGGAMFPTHVKLSPQKEIDTILLNGCECEPYITCDDRLMQEYPKEIIEGLKIIMYILDVPKSIVVIEDNKVEAIKAVEKIVFNEPNITLKVLKTKYPQGAEKQLIKTVLNREVPPGKLPFDVGVLVHNVGTSYAIYEAIKLQKPLVYRIVTITGNVDGEFGNYRVRIGTTVSDIVKMLNISNFNKVIFGGLMMGISQPSLEVPVIKGTSAILFMNSEDKNEYSDCIRCTSCISACPMKLLPNMISIYVEKEMWDRVEEFFPFDCIECGCCSYVCVANRPLVQHIKLAKTKLKK